MCLDTIKVRYRRSHADIAVARRYRRPVAHFPDHAPETAPCLAGPFGDRRVCPYHATVPRISTRPHDGRPSDNRWCNRKPGPECTVVVDDRFDLLIDRQGVFEDISTVNLALEAALTGPEFRDHAGRQTHIGKPSDMDGRPRRGHQLEDLRPDPFAGGPDNAFVFSADDIEGLRRDVKAKDGSKTECPKHPDRIGPNSLFGHQADRSRTEVLQSPRGINQPVRPEIVSQRIDGEIPPAQVFFNAVTRHGGKIERIRPETIR